MKLHIQQHLIRTKAAWAVRGDVIEACGPVGAQIQGNMCLYGKTVGLLVSYCVEHNIVPFLTQQGYGHVGRETARLFKAFGCRIIAANSKGDKRKDDGVSSSAILFDYH